MRSQSASCSSTRLSLPTCKLRYLHTMSASAVMFPYALPIFGSIHCHIQRGPVPPPHRCVCNEFLTSIRRETPNKTEMHEYTCTLLKATARLFFGQLSSLLTQGATPSGNVKSTPSYTDIEDRFIFFRALISRTTKRLLTLSPF